MEVIIFFFSIIVVNYVFLKYDIVEAKDHQLGYSVGVAIISIVLALIIKSIFITQITTPITCTITLTLKKINQYRTYEYILRREGDSNPRYALLRTAVQQTAGLSHSPTSPIIWKANIITSFRHRKCLMIFLFVKKS